MYFPSVIVCNINQIRKSFVRGLGLSNYDEIDLLYRQFYTGLDRNLTKQELNTILSLATSEVIESLILIIYQKEIRDQTCIDSMSFCTNTTISDHGEKAQSTFNNDGQNKYY